MVVPGFFGKLPTLGDFVSRGWLGTTRDGLDKLLQQAIGSLLASSPDAKETIASSPCSALSIRPGVIGEHGLVAVVMPSQDRVGRVFPLCAGVQWSDDGQGIMGWPSLQYARSLMVRVQECISADADPELLLVAIGALGDPRDSPRTFGGLGADETLPRLGAEERLLCFRGPLAALTPAHAALCSMLADGSDVLGMRLGNEAQEFFVCRRLATGSALASMFDGHWEERGWLCFRDRPAGRDAEADTPQTEDDETRPKHRVIDTTARSPDSPNRH